MCSIERSLRVLRDWHEQREACTGRYNAVEDLYLDRVREAWSLLSEEDRAEAVQLAAEEGLIPGVLPFRRRVSS